MVLARSALAVTAMIVAGSAVSTASPLDCRVLEQRNYRPSPQQPTAQSDLERPRRVACDVDLDHLLVGDYCIQQVGTVRFVRARIFASGNHTIALRALLSVQIAPYRSFVDIISSYVGPKRYFGEARDSSGKELEARRVLHQFPQEDDDDVQPPCVNTSFVTVAIASDVLRSRTTSSYQFVVADDSNHSLRARISGRMIDAVLKAANCQHCR
jgi:hypothetical protein